MKKNKLTYNIDFLMLSYLLIKFLPKLHFLRIHGITGCREAIKINVGNVEILTH